MSRRFCTLTFRELEIMKVIWPMARATVRDVYDALCARRTIAYTTVHTMMNVLEAKGHLIKEPGNRAQLYVPVRTEEEVAELMVREFVHRVFAGSVETLLAHILEDDQLILAARPECRRTGVRNKADNTAPSDVTHQQVNLSGGRYSASSKSTASTRVGRRAGR